jgi:hypothetical protein
MALSRRINFRGVPARLWCCLLLCSLTAIGQTADPVAAPVAKSADEVMQLVASTYERNAIASISAPYHFRATFETFDTAGQTAGSGSIERWASSPQLMKTVTRFGDHAMAEYFDNGKKLYTDDGFGGNIMSYFANYSVFYGIFPPAGILHRKPQATSVVSLPNGDTLDCQGYVFEIGPPGFPQPPNDRFCVSRASNDLVLRHTSNLTIRFSDFAPFHDKSIAHTITGSQGSQVRFRVKVEQLDQAGFPDEQMTAPANASLTSPEADIWATTPEETHPTHDVRVNVPPALKASHASGAVELYVLISRSGRVTDVEPRFAASPELASYAIQVVNGYSYKPIMRNGKPIQEISTSFLMFKF